MSLYRVIVLCFALVVSGTLQHNHRGRISGGTDAADGQFPFVIAILYHASDLLSQFCDGVIINNKWILTVSQCTKILPDDIAVLVGSTSLNTSQRFNISYSVTHEEYNFWTGQNDIGLLQIEGEFTFDNDVQPVELGDVEENQTCTLLGWGLTMNYSSLDVLQYIETTTFDVDECKELVLEVEKGVYFGPETVCTRSAQQNASACWGDGGGPLVCNGKVAAILTNAPGFDCGTSYPNVYTKVTPYLDWIQTHIDNATTTTPSSIENTSSTKTASTQNT